MGGQEFVMTAIYSAIETKYGFAIPREYREMEQLGWFNLRESSYLWVHEAEWLRPSDILGYEPEDYHKPGFIPFAFNAAGDHWCWWPQENAVVSCPHDYNLGEFDAPTFLGSIYRRMLEYTVSGFYLVHETESRDYLRDWAVRLRRFFPTLWTDTLSRAADAPIVNWQRDRMSGHGFMTLDEYDRVITRDLKFDRLGQTFEWMHS